MHYYEVAPNEIVRSDSAFFTYSSDQPLHIGQLVFIEVGKRSLIGVVIKQVGKPSYTTKSIQAILDEVPIPEPLVKLALWLSSYYATHLATALQVLLPRGLKKKRRKHFITNTITLRDRTKKLLTKEQQNAIKKISTISNGVILLHGVTGSGKTNVYIETAKKTLEGGRSVIILVPEIALTPQLVDEFSVHFSEIVVTHSHQTEAERHLIWQKVLHNTKPIVTIGPRSALFLPLKNVGLIVIDEAHEPSFKQEQSPRYSALRAASVLASYHNAKVILGSATPSITDYYIATHVHRPIITMQHRAREDAKLPEVSLIDSTQRTAFKQHRFLSDKLLLRLEETLSRGRQVLIFHNRRGSANVTLCESCGWSSICARCFIPFTLHADFHKLECHICGLTERIPTSCPICNSTEIFHKGIGTKLIEAELHKLFPRVTHRRFDGDNTDKESIENHYEALYKGDVQLIIGTQVIAKGLDLPRLETVGIIQADAGLSLPDYTSSERTFQLLAQVVGRVGRSRHNTHVIVQSYKLDHPSIKYGIMQDYNHFYQKTILEREKGLFPPFAYVLKLICIYRTEEASIRNARTFAAVLRSHFSSKDIQILGPTPAFYERYGDTYRWQLILKAKKRTQLVEALKYLPSSHWQFELDPSTLL